MKNNSKKGFSLLSLLITIIVVALLIFIIVWLFQKKVPNMKPFYSNLFRENVNYMQEAGEAYFTDEKMPQADGESVRLTLQEMENLNLIYPFVDKDGKSCDKNASYVSITKLADDKGYELKTYLVCGSESSYVVKILGCHTYCPYGNCTQEKKCEISKITEYEYKKLVSGSATKYTCPSGYSLKGSECIKTTLKDSISALKTKTETKTYTKPATLVQGEATLKPLTVVTGTKTESKAATTGTSTVDATATTQTQTATASTQTKDATATTSTQTQDATASTQTKAATASTSTQTQAATASTSTQAATASTSSQNATASTSTQAATKGTQSYACTKTRTVQKCETTYRQEAYSCNCSTKLVGGVLTTTCDTCYRSVPVQSCHDVQETYTDTCYRDTYSCPSGWTLSGTTCSKTTYSCPSGWTLSGTSCKKTTYSCPSGWTLSGTNCTKKVTTYSCDSGWTLSGTNCKKTVYSCASGWTLSGTKCTKKVTSYKCDSGWTLSGTKCSKTTYSCASGWTLSGTSCKKTTYSCASGYTLSGTKCSKTTYSCASGWTLSGTNCTRQVKTYTCPSGTDVQEGSGSSLKCYKLISGSVSYKCTDSGYKLNGTSCVKTVKETVTYKECDKPGYKLEGNKCNLYTTQKTTPTAKETDTSHYEYKWSRETELDGYTRTGKTRTVDGEEICK